MSERDVFERRLEAGVREFVETAPTEVDAARLTRSLATDVPRVRRLVPRPAWRPPRLGLAWIPLAAALLVLLGAGLVVSGALRDVLEGPVRPTPGIPLETPPAVIASPAATAAPSSPTPELTPAPTPASRAQPVVITSLMLIPETGPNTGTFETSGEASSSGAVCGSGTVKDLVAIDREAFARGELLESTIPKELTCGDGSGTFVVDVDIRVDAVERTESLRWLVVRGTGAYTRLRGGGDGTTTNLEAGKVLNVYTGSLSE